MSASSFTLNAEPTGTVRPVTPAVAPAVTPAVPPVVNAERPAWLDNKFKSPEQMAESYKNLEAELTRLRQGEPPAPAAKPDETKPTADAKAEEKADEKPEEKAVTDALKADGIDVDAMSARFWEKGEIAAEDRTLLVASLKKDFGDKAETLLDAFATAQKEAFEYREFRIHEPMGGKDKSGPIIEWAKANMTQVQKETINSLWASDDVAKHAEGSRMVAAAYKAANGSQPTRVLDGGAPAVSAAGYGSRAEMSADMTDPRYKSDPAFQQKVIQKLAATTAF